MPKRKQNTVGGDGTSYIVRVYRCDAHGIAGVVEMPVQERQTAFRSFAELESILTGTSGNRGEDRRSRG